jgi:hypothetical protein
LSEKGGNGGNNSGYLLRKLAREKPEILERYECGEFDSVKAAARAAGIIPPKLTRFEQIVKWLPSLSAEERHKLKEMLG